MSKFSHDAAEAAANDARALTIPRRFSKNSRAKNCLGSKQVVVNLPGTD